MFVRAVSFEEIMHEASPRAKNKTEDEGFDEFKIMTDVLSLLEDALAISLMRTELMRFEVYTAIRKKDFQFLDSKVFMPALAFFV